MNATQQRRVLFGTILAGLSMLVVGCANHLIRPTAQYPTRADFSIKFTPDKVVITPNAGDAIVHLSRSPVRGDNQLVWVSKTEEFQIEFETLGNPTQPPPSPFPMGWQPATRKDGVWQFVVELDQGPRVPDIRALKYSVKHQSGAPIEDPVLIVRN